DRREEALRAAERPPGGFEGCDLDAGALLEDLQFREIRARDLEVQCAFVRVEPELLAELVLVSLLPHVEGALAQAARDGPGDRHRFFDLEYPLVVRVLLPDDLPAARRQSDPLAAGREVSGDQTLPDKLEDSLGCALLAQADEHAELAEDRRRDRHVDVPQDATEFCIEMDLELERHEEGVRVEEGESGHRFRASMPNYLALQ